MANADNIITDLKEDHENFGVSNAINNVDQVQFEVENGKVEASKANGK